MHIKRKCIDCKGDISKTHKNRQRCDKCSRIREHELWLQTREVIVLRECIECKKLMCHTPGIAFTRKRCTECNRKYRKELGRINSEKHRAKEKRKRKNKPRGHCIDCGAEFGENTPGNKLRCSDCKRKHIHKCNLERFHSILRVSYCIDCNADISHRANKAYRCAKCQRKFNNKKRRDARKEAREQKERNCKKCGNDISHRSPNAVLCWTCRRKNAIRAQTTYNKAHKEEHLIAQNKYYEKHKKRIMNVNNQYQKKQRQKKKKILKTKLPEKDPYCSKWVEWDDIPRCEGICLDTKSHNNPFGTECDLRACYRLSDKFDKSVRFVCGFHLRTIGSLRYYHIEKIEHQVIIRKLTKVKWKKIQIEEHNKNKEKRKEKEKWKKRKPPMPYPNAQYPIDGNSHPHNRF